MPFGIYPTLVQSVRNEKCDTINTITLEKEEVKKQEKFAFFG